MLVSIAEKLDHRSDIRNLRLVDKRFHSAVGESAIHLRPHWGLTSAQLLNLSQLFRSATSLNLSSCNRLNNECLRGLHNLFPRLRKLDLSDCPWLAASGMANLLGGLPVGLSKLQVLSLYHCTALSQLPHSISGLVSLEHFNLRFCENIRSVPEGVSRLLSLVSLSLGDCSELEGVPDGIGALSLLEQLHLQRCRWVRLGFNLWKYFEGKFWQYIDWSCLICLKWFEVRFATKIFIFL